MSQFVYSPGKDVTLADADIIVNTVNCVGIMGAGVAKAFKDRFGKHALQPYWSLCREHKLKPGTSPIFTMPDGRRWAAFATKNHWKHHSQLHWVQAGLYDLARNAKTLGARSIALPPPGCGLGNLKWTDVEPIVLDALRDFHYINIFAPTTIPAGITARKLIAE